MILYCSSIHAQEGIKEQYQSEDNQQNTVIVKDGTLSDQDILNQLDLDDFVFGQEVEITAEMLEQLRQQKEKAEKNPAPSENLATEESSIALQEEVEQVDMVVLPPNLVKEVEKEVHQVQTKEPTSTRTQRTSKPNLRASKSSSIKKKKYKKKRKKKKRVKYKKHHTKRRNAKGKKGACYTF